MQEGFNDFFITGKLNTNRVVVNLQSLNTNGTIISSSIGFLNGVLQDYRFYHRETGAVKLKLAIQAYAENINDFKYEVSCIPLQTSLV